MKSLIVLCLLTLSLTMGCSPPAGEQGDANDPALTTDLQPVDPAKEPKPADAP